MPVPVASNGAAVVRGAQPALTQASLRGMGGTIVGFVTLTAGACWIDMALEVVAAADPEASVEDPLREAGGSLILSFFSAQLAQFASSRNRGIHVPSSRRDETGSGTLDVITTAFHFSIRTAVGQVVSSWLVRCMGRESWSIGPGQSDEQGCG